MSGYACYGVSDNCINIYSYGEICVRCGCCEAEEPNEKKRISNQIKYYSERLEEEKNFSNWADDEEFRKIQEKNVKDNIKYFEKKINELKEQKMVEFGKWVEIKTRPLTEEEKQEYEDEAEWYEFIYDCELPDHGQEVLVQLHYGIAMTTFYTDMGCYFENYEDEDDVLAWMPLPKEFVKEQDND